MRALAILAIALSVATPAVGEDAPKKIEEPGTHVQMPFLIAPMNVDDKLAGYAYISSKLVAATPSASVEIRDKLAFIQDAFVRDVNAQPISKASDPTAVDTAALAVRLVADAKRVVGAAKVTGITFTQIQFSPLHPKTTTEDAIPPSQRGSQPATPQNPAAQTSATTVTTPPLAKAKTP